MKTKWFPFWVVPLVILFAVSTVWLRLMLVRTTYSLNQTNRQIANLMKDREDAQLKLAELRSPRRLEVLAKTRFGLVQPKADQIIHMK